MQVKIISFDYLLDRIKGKNIGERYASTCHLLDAIT